jgi:predicted Zn-dependent protease with MMP-like domain
MSLLNLSRLWQGKRKARDLSDVERDRALRVFLNDTRCVLVLSDNAGQEVARYERLAENNDEPQAMLVAAIQALPPDTEKQIGNVEVFIDDPELSVVDSRQAKLSHFEGRALAEFGKYQLGGKPVCFASHRFGATGASETEKRVVAYIPEDRLTAVLFALGKLARFTTFFGPWSLQPLLLGESEETRAQLAVHSRYSTLALTNDSAGAVAVRHFPVGAANLAEAYAKVHGIEPQDAAEALTSRARLAIGKEWPLPAGTPAAYTGTHMALVPMLEKLTGEITATGDYFEFQRLAGRAAELKLSQMGAKVAGFAGWLSDMLQVGVADAEAAPHDKAPALNLLEGMRTGLLKIGNQHYDFAGGRFMLSANQPGAGNQGVTAKWKSASSQPLTLDMLKPIAMPLAAAGAGLAVLTGTYLFLLAPIEQERATAANLYSGTLARIAQANVKAAKPVAEPVLWARDMMAVSAAMPYDMKLKRLALIPGTGSAGTSFELDGTLPMGGADNLQLISRFMKRLSASPALRRRFTEISFGGAADGDAKIGEAQNGGATDSQDSVFKLVAKVGPGGATR